MPNLKRITPAVALAIALVVTMVGLAFAGPNSGAKIASTPDKSSGVKAGDTVTLTVSATVLSGLTGFSVDVLYDSNAVGTPAATVKLQGGVPLPASIGATTVSGYNRKATAGSAILGGSLAATSSDLVAFAFVTKTGFTTTNLALSQVILIAGAQRDTIPLSPSPLVVQINPPAPPAPAIALSDTTVKFDTTRVGASAQKTFTISNTGGSALAVTGITVVGRDSLQFTASPKTDTVAAGGRRTITVTFAPTSDGSKTASLSIAHNATGSPSRVALSGTGVKKVDVGPPKVETTTAKQSVVSASFTNSPTDTITWTVSGTIAGTNVRIVAINGDTALARRLAPSALTGAAVSFKAPAAVSGASTITLGVVNPLAATGSLTATVVAESGGSKATSQVIFSVPVPAELSAFSGVFAEGQVQLNWTTVSQTNNAGWRILRSTDNEHFEPVSGIVPGAGTSNERLDYRYADVSLPKDVDKLYYVLEQVDLDGKVTRSRVAEVLLGGRFADMPKEFSTAVYPNPFNPATTIAYSLPEAAKVSIVIYDAIGQEVRTLIGSAETAAGRYTVQWDARDSSGRPVASGVYFAHITAGKFKDIRKMMLLK